MKAWFLAVGLLVSTGCPVGAVTITMTPPPKVFPPAPPKTEAKAACPCDCPQEQKKKTTAQAPSRAVAKSYRAHFAYRYAEAAPFHPTWFYRQPGPALYGPPPANNEQGLHIDNDGWNGGVGSAPEGGGGGGFVDGYGQVHFPTDAGNGPTYNSYNQSSQFNPSQPGPFQPRLMGGFAPPSNSGSH